MSQTIFANTCLSTMNLRISCSKVLIETIVVLQLAPSDPLSLKSETRFASVDYSVARHRLTDLTLDCPRLTGAGVVPTSEVRTSSILKWLMNYGVEVTQWREVPDEFHKIFQLVPSFLCNWYRVSLPKCSTISDVETSEVYAKTCTNQPWTIRG
jgi:hypothetical protein